jgi:hypothetical protein
MKEGSVPPSKPWENDLQDDVGCKITQTYHLGLPEKALVLGALKHLQVGLVLSGLSILPILIGERKPQHGIQE